MIKIFAVSITIVVICSCLNNGSNNSNLEDQEVPIYRHKTDTSKYYWENHTIDSAVLYVYYSDSARLEGSYRMSDLSIITADGLLNQYVIDEFTQVLDSSQRSDLQKYFTRKTEIPGQGSGCYSPHHGIVMWDSDGKQIGDFTVCLECENYELRPDSQLPVDLKEIEKLVKSFQIPANWTEIEEYRMAKKKKKSK